MAKRDAYVYVGTWEMPCTHPGEHGILRYTLDTDAMTMTGEVRLASDINVGLILPSADGKTLYVTDERKTFPNANGEFGSRFLALPLNERGEAAGEGVSVPSYGTYPCFLSLTEHGEQLLLCNLGSSDPVTKAALGEDGQVITQRLYDDSNILVYQLEHGLPAGVTDLYTAAGTGPHPWQTTAHVHSVAYDRRNGFIFACNRGGDEILTFRLDEAGRKLIRVSAYRTEPGTGPRYSLMPAAGSRLVISNEIMPTLDVYEIGPDGSLARTGSTNLLDACRADTVSAFGIHPSDIRMDPRGYVYAALRGADCILVYRLDEADGRLVHLQTVGCGGENPRSLCITPDGSTLLCANVFSSNVAMFRIQEDGTLLDSGSRAGIRHAAALCVTE